MISVPNKYKSGVIAFGLSNFLRFYTLDFHQSLEID